MAKYSTIKQKFAIDVENNANNDLAYFTHYLHNHTNGVSRHYKQEAANYFCRITGELGLIREPYIQELLPISFDIPFPPPKNSSFTFIDLFAGIGGFRIPLQELGGKCVFSSEFNKHAQKTYELNFGEIPFGDITNIDLSAIPPHDVLTAGFPCQPFSISGKMKGFEDTRGTLIYYILQIIESQKPRVVFLENVKHLVHHDDGRTLTVILNNLKKLGYMISWKILNASDFSVPQNRERIIIIGHREKLFDFSKIKYKNRKSLKGFLDVEADFEYLNEPYTILSEYRIQDSGLIFIGYRNKKIRKAGVRPGTENLSRVHKQPNRIYSSEGLHPALPSQETSGRFWIYHEGSVRKLTIRECYRIMGFPEKFIKRGNIGELYKQIGNSVCIPMIKEIGMQIQEQLL